MRLSAVFNLNTVANTSQAQSAMSALADRVNDTAAGLGVAAANAARLARSGIAGRGGGGGGGRGGGGGGLDPEEHRQRRGVMGSRGAAGRDFAGMARAGDTSGFVAAYATIASTLFALTAAFQALNNAAKFDQLTKGLQLVGAQAGVTLTLVAKSVRQITDFGLSTADSMRVVAQATTSGIDSDSIVRLAGVAKGASQALGRDLSDSMDRLVRGVSKLEPELLDELGIMTRLDDATRMYAIANNKAASSLTITEKKQAFLNAVMEEGEKKFKSISEQIPVNKYDKLIASLKDLGTTFAKIINTALDPFISLMTAAPATAILPFIGVIRMAASRVLPDFRQSMDDTREATNKFLGEAVRLENLGIEARQSRPSQSNAQNLQNYQKEQLIIEQLAGVTENSTYNLERFADRMAGENNPFRILSKTGSFFADTWRDINDGVVEFENGMTRAGRRVGTVTRATTFLRLAMASTGATVAALGIAINSLLPWIGILVAGFSAVGALINYFRGERGKTIDKAKDDLNEVVKNAKEVDKQIKIAFDERNFSAGLQAAISSMNELTNKAKQLEAALNSAGNTKFKTQPAGFSLLDSITGADKIYKAQAAFAAKYEVIYGTDAAKKLQKDFVRAGSSIEKTAAIMNVAAKRTENLATVFTDLGEEAKKGGDAVRKFYGEGFFKSKYSDIADTFINITKQIELAQESGIKDPGLAVFQELKKGGIEYFQEMDRLMGNNSNQFKKMYQDELALSVRLSSAQNNLDSKKQGTKAWKEAKKEVDAITTELNKLQNIIVSTVQDSGVLIKGQLYGFTVLLATVNAEIDKLNLNLAEIQSSTAKTLLDAANLNKDAARTRLVGSYKSPIDESNQRAYDLAKFEYNNAKNIAALKNKVIQSQYDLNKSELQLAVFTAKQQLADFQQSATFNEEKKTWVFKTTAEAERYNLQRSIILALEDQFSLQEDIRDASIAQNNAEVRLSSAKLNNAEAIRDAYNSEYDVQTRLIDLAKVRISQAEQLRDIEKQRKDLSIDIAEQEARNTARREGREFDSRPFDRQRIEEQLRQARGIAFGKGVSQNASPALAEIRNSIRQEKELQTFAGALGGNIPQQRQELLNRLREEESALVKKLAEESGLAADEVKNLVLKLEELTTLDIGTLMRNLIGKSAENRNISAAGFGVGLAGAGSEFQTALQEYVSGTPGMTAQTALANPETVKTLKDSALAMKGLSLEAEAFDTISSSINNNMVSAFKGIIDGSMSAGQAFAQMAQAILADIAAMIAKMLVFKLIQTAMGGAPIPIPMATGGIIPMASGGIMNRAQGIQGIVSKPTYLIGEGKQNEAVVPLPNGREIPVQLQGSSSNSNNVQVNVNMSGNGGQATTETQGQDMNQLGQAIAVAVQRELINQKRPGGILSRYGAA